MKLFAQVEGMTPSVLEKGLPWDWESFPTLLNVLDTPARHQRRHLRRALRDPPLRHGRGRVGARGDRRRDPADGDDRARGDARRRGGLHVVEVADARRPSEAPRAVAEGDVPGDQDARRGGGRGRRRLDRLPRRDGGAGLHGRGPPAHRRAGARVGAAGRRAGHGLPPGREGAVGRPGRASSPTRARRARPSTRCSARSRSCGRSTGAAARRSSRAASRGASSPT